MKKLVAIVLAFVMFFTLVPSQAYATGETGGTSTGSASSNFVAGS